MNMLKGPKVAMITYIDNEPVWGCVTNTRHYSKIGVTLTRESLREPLIRSGDELEDLLNECLWDAQNDVLKVFGLTREEL